jgi:hypothetical protein
MIPDGHVHDRDEDEQIPLCDNPTVRQRLKTYRQLYSWLPHYSETARH